MDIDFRLSMDKKPDKLDYQDKIIFFKNYTLPVLRNGFIRNFLLHLLGVSLG